MEQRQARKGSKAGNNRSKGRQDWEQRQTRIGAKAGNERTEG